MIEKRIHKRLYSLHQSDCLFTYQFVFHNHRSTNHPLISIKVKIRKNLDEGKFTYVVFLDFFWCFFKQHILPNFTNSNPLRLPLTKRW